MLFSYEELINAFNEYTRFKSNNLQQHHLRYIFPLFDGTYFCYRKLDILRIANIAQILSNNPTYIDIGCGIGDFLSNVRNFIHNAKGIELDPTIFYLLRKPVPDNIIFLPVESLKCDQLFDIAFIGWMQPDIDFRNHVAKIAKCIITTFDSGGQCGKHGDCDYDEFGFRRIGYWRTPSWIDVNTELMNKFYTSSLKNNNLLQNFLNQIRTCHNLWYVYVKDSLAKNISNKFRAYIQLEEQQKLYLKEKFNFEKLLDDCGFGYHENIPSLISKEKRLWKVVFDSI
ncbi:MAG: hypothetical protein ACPKQO_02465 [Nitrososphaeraceae archaeon]